MSQSGKLALFIDGANLYSTARALGFDIDFRKLLAVFQERGRLVRAFYYTPVEDQEGSSTRPLVDWLGYNGYKVRTRSVWDFSDQNARRKARSSLSIELAVNAFEVAPYIDEMVLFTGDGDFRSLVEAIQRHGVRVTLVSTIAAQPALIAEELRRQADVFIDLADLRSQIARDERPRPPAIVE